jgi:hypothetical protein
MSKKLLMRKQKKDKTNKSGNTGILAYFEYALLYFFML